MNGDPWAVRDHGVIFLGAALTGYDDYGAVPRLINEFPMVPTVPMRDLLKLPDDFEGNVRALLRTPPAPHDTAGSRKAAPKPPPKPRNNNRKKVGPKAKVGTYAYESAPVGATKKAAKKR